MVLPFPNLPEGQWPLTVQSAFTSLQELYTHSLQLIAQNDTDDVLRFRIAAENINHQGEALLDLENHGIPPDWVHEVILCLAVTREALLRVVNGIQEGEPSNIRYFSVVSPLHTGKRGRPRKVIDFNYLQEAFTDHRNITITRLAEVIKVHPNTLTAYMKLYDLDNRFSQLSDDDLDNLIRNYREQRPLSGIRYVVGYLRRLGHKVQRRRVIGSIKRVDGLGTTMRRRIAIRRRRYAVRRPNALWHCDGHHKLIRWGIVLHGFIDGYSRLITALRASNTNSASRVLEVFEQGIAEFGAPSRLRGDRGGENVKVSVWMIMHRGPDRASFMWGSSTHNTRIERLWVEVGSQFVRQWRGFFLRLERLYNLNHRMPGHIWLLHFLFLDEINADADSFREDWNHHPLSSPGVGNLSPHDLFFIGQTSEGLDISDFDEVPVEQLHQYYGVHGARRHRLSTKTGAGHPIDEQVALDAGSGIPMDVDDSDAEDTPPEQLDPMEQLVADSIQNNIRHAPIKVQRHACPFNKDQVSSFGVLVAELLLSPLPGVEIGSWDAVESIPLGRRKELRVDLGSDRWLFRARKWVLAVELFTRLTGM